MACPHVSAIAALIIATGVLGKHPKPERGGGAHRGDRTRPRPAGLDDRYGAGLVDAGPRPTRRSPLALRRATSSG